jgi:hypothetical protein
VLCLLLEHEDESSFSETSLRLYIQEDVSFELYAWRHTVLAPVPECEVLTLSYSIKQADGGARASSIRATALEFRDRTAQKSLLCLETCKP